jgi:hypothetical protein
MREALAVLALALLAFTGVSAPVERRILGDDELLEPPLAVRYAPGLPAAVADRLRPLLGRDDRIRALVYEFERIPSDLAAALADDGPAAFGEDEHRQLRAAAAAGALRLVEVVEGDARLGESIRLRSGPRRHAALRREIESAEAAVVVFPVARSFRHGLDVTVRTSVRIGDGLHVAYEILRAGKPRIRAQDTIGGPLERVSVPVQIAQGAVRLEPGEAAPLLFQRPDGSGTLVLLRLEGAPIRTPSLIRLGDGRSLISVGHLRTTPVPESWPPTEERDRVRESIAWRSLVARLDPAIEWKALPLDHRVGRLDPATRPLLRAVLNRGAAIRARRGNLVVRRKGSGRIRVPVGAGEPFLVREGAWATLDGGIDVEAGCQTCVLAAQSTLHTWVGLGAWGRVGVDGAIEVELEDHRLGEARVEEHRVFRIEAGYRNVVRDPLTVRLVDDEVLAVRATCPSGGSDLPGDAAVLWRTDGAPDPEALWVPPALAGASGEAPRWPIGAEGWLANGDSIETRARLRPIFLVVNGHPLPVRPGTEATLTSLVRRPRIRAWVSEGHCGMRIRYPVPSSRAGWPSELLMPPYAGIRIQLSPELREDGLHLSCDAELRGRAEAIETFDPGDGAVEIVRRPVLRAEIRDLAFGAGGRLAWGAGLSLDVVRPGHESRPGPHRRLEADAPGGSVGLRTGLRSAGRLSAGGWTVLPTRLVDYQSNHEAGEVRTDFDLVRDGVDLSVDAGETSEVELTIRSRPTWKPHDVRASVAPRRDGLVFRTPSVGRRVVRRTWPLPPHSLMEARSPEGSALPFRVLAGDTK